MRILLLSCLFLFSSSALFSLSPNDALNKLQSGNKRFYKEKLLNQNRETVIRLSESEAQFPFAVILACADSRVAPEIIFDQGIGDLFVVRVAGNVVGSLELESINYAVKYLGASCVLVVGHEQCGAVDAVIQKTTKTIPFTAELIKPAVIMAKQSNSDNLLKTAIEINAQDMAEFLTETETFNQLVTSGKLIIKPAYYSFQSGKVKILSN